MKKNQFGVVALILLVFGFGYWLNFLNAPHVDQASQSSPSTERCPRESVGAELANTEDLFSKDGVLAVTLEYKSLGDSDDTHFCFLMNNGKQSPTLHVKPGDHLRVTLKNSTTSARTVGPAGSLKIELPKGKICASPYIDETSTNMHFHGTNTPPTCGSDEVINTVINAGETFTYDLAIPANEPPGTYFYHPHIHGKSQNAVWGGATGIIVVDGIQNYFPKLAGLNDRIITVRDTEGLSDDKLERIGWKRESPENEAKEVPSFELSVNYHPVTFPKYITPKLHTKPETYELWRIANTSADAILNVRLVYDDKTQPFTIVGIDGVPTGTYGGAHNAKSFSRNNWILGPANRVEILVKTPGLNVKQAYLVTDKYDTGADIDPQRPLLRIVPDANAPESKLKVPAVNGKPLVHRFTAMLRAVQSRLFGQKRKLYFAQKDIQDPDDATKATTEFYITVEGHKDEAFNMQRPADIVTREESLEEWTIENRTEEAHVFHIHQIHFLLLEKDGKAVTGDEKQSYDTIVIPKYDGKKDGSGKPIYPSVKVRMDFHETKPGAFVYHCHILEHEDKGMMGIIKVMPKETPRMANEIL